MTESSAILPADTLSVTGPEGAGVSHLQVEPTTRCNYTCAFCCGRKMDQNDLQLDTFERALDQFPEVQRLELHGEGEPLLHPRFFDMVGLARARGAGISIITNGSMFSERRIDRILSSGIESVMVSIESADPNEFSAIRGGKLEKVATGIRALIQARDARGLRFPTVGFAITVLRRTREAMPEIAELYTRLGMDGGLPVHMLNAMPFYLDVYDERMKAQLLSKTEQALTWSRYVRLTRSPELSGSTRQFWDKVFGENLPSARSAPGARPTAKTYRSCPWLDDGLYVDRHGLATGCPRIKDTGRHAFGRIGESSREDILEARGRLAREVRAGTLPEPCSGCFIAESISQRLTSLLDKKPSPPPMESKQSLHRRTDTGPVVGSVPMDASSSDDLVALCNGSRTTREVLAALAERYGEDADETRRRALPVLNELIRAGTLSL